MAKKDNEITVRITGKAGCGKSTLAALIFVALRNAGIEATLHDDSTPEILLASPKRLKTQAKSSERSPRFA